jgi:hypothetical protein
MMQDGARPESMGMYQAISAHTLQGHVDNWAGGFRRDVQYPSVGGVSNGAAHCIDEQKWHNVCVGVVPAIGLVGAEQQSMGQMPLQTHKADTQIGK